MRDGVEYGQIACAPAQVTAHVSDDLFVGGMRILVEQRFGREDHPRRAEAALKSEMIEKGLLQRGKAARGIEKAFDGGDGLIGNVVGVQGAGADGKPTDNDV